MSIFNKVKMIYSKSNIGRKAIKILNQADSFFYNQKNIKAALELYDEVLKESFSFSDNNLAYIYRNRGNCLQSLNFDYEAIADFNKSIALNGEDWLTYFLRSLSFGAIIKNDEKKKDLLKAQAGAGLRPVSCFEKAKKFFALMGQDTVCKTEALGPRQQKNRYINKKRLSRQETASFVYQYD